MRTHEIWPDIMPENKFHQGSAIDGRHYWLTPPALYARLAFAFVNLPAVHRLERYAGQLGADAVIRDP